MEIQKMLEDMNTAIDAIYQQPEEVLRILGQDYALQLINKLSVSPELEAELKECKLMKLIESGTKYVTGQIIVEEQEESTNE